MVKWITGWSSNLKVVGSKPGKGAYISKKKNNNVVDVVETGDNGGGSEGRRDRGGMVGIEGELGE